LKDQTNLHIVAPMFATERRIAALSDQIDQTDRGSE
jgi:hypothetical protein